MGLYQQSNFRCVGLLEYTCRLTCISDVEYYVEFEASCAVQIAYYTWTNSSFTHRASKKSTQWWLMATYCTRVHVLVYVRRDRYSSCGHRSQVDGTLVLSERRRCVSVCGSSFCDVYIRESHIIAVCEARTHHLATKAKDNTERNVHESSRLLSHPCHWDRCSCRHLLGFLAPPL